MQFWNLRWLLKSGFADAFEIGECDGRVPVGQFVDHFRDFLETHVPADFFCVFVEIFFADVAFVFVCKVREEFL